MHERLLAEEWLPSRFNLAMFRALGLLVATILGRRPSPATILHHDRAHHPLEAYSLSCALIAVPSIHVLGAAVPRLSLQWLTIPLVVVALPFAAVIAWDIVVFSVAIVALILGKASGRKVDALSMQTPVIHGLMVALSISAVAFRWRTAWLGWMWLALVALNALCALGLAARRERVAGFARGVLQEP
ncbi:MAG: hypothetical protein HYU52_17375 [Acidobacteria bacterium]|nr:hypothetical protein [Acidobacteriota bacterium]